MDQCSLRYRGKKVALIKLMKPKISIIAAMDSKNGIGKNGMIPWHIREDLIRLKNLTKDSVVILGRKTYDSMVYYYNRTGRSMPGKLYFIVTRDRRYIPARNNATTVKSIDEVVEKTKEEQGEIFVIGGQSIFEQTIGIADKLYLTIVKGDYKCDTFFPDYSEFKKVVYSEKRKEGNLKYEFIDLEKQS